jgi:hypothetical protein
MYVAHEERLRCATLSLNIYAGHKPLDHRFAWVWSFRSRAPKQMMRTVFSTAIASTSRSPVRARRAGAHATLSVDAPFTHRKTLEKNAGLALIRRTSARVPVFR